ncbi:MAG: NUDIX domain-containing protein [Spirochaetota bacterium]|nr:NUDIX domain-containing protein [Spirochaetota bacterium]
MIIKKVVSSFLWDGEKILILKRSEKVGNHRGKWAGISGHLDESTPLKQAYKEIFEETTIKEHSLTLIKEGNYVEVYDVFKGNEITWQIYPFLFRVETDINIELDWEHDDMKWIVPDQVKDFDTVPGLCDVLKTVFEY